MRGRHALHKRSVREWGGGGSMDKFVMLSVCACRCGSFCPLAIRTRWSEPYFEDRNREWLKEGHCKVKWFPFLKQKMKVLGREAWGIVEFDTCIFLSLSVCVGCVCVCVAVIAVGLLRQAETSHSASKTQLFLSSTHWSDVDLMVQHHSRQL